MLRTRGSSGAVRFAAGTPILMADGSSKPIEGIQPGDMVLAASDQDPEGPVEPKPVLEVYHNRPERLMELQIGDLVVRPTLKHPFYVRGKGWTAAADLELGDQLRTHDGRWVPLTGKEDRGEVAPVFNFHVADHRTYFLGAGHCDLSVLVHNQSASVDENRRGALLPGGGWNPVNWWVMGLDAAHKKAVSSGVPQKVAKYAREFWNLKIPTPIPKSAREVGSTSLVWEPHHAYQRFQAGDPEYTTTIGEEIIEVNTLIIEAALAFSAYFPHISFEISHEFRGLIVL